MDDLLLLLSAILFWIALLDNQKVISHNGIKKKQISIFPSLARIKITCP